MNRKPPVRATDLVRTTDVDLLRRHVLTLAIRLEYADRLQYINAIRDCAQNERPEEQVRERGAA